MAVPLAVTLPLLSCFSGLGLNIEHTRDVQQEQGRRPLASANSDLEGQKSAVLTAQLLRQTKPRNENNLTRGSQCAEQKGS